MPELYAHQTRALELMREKSMLLAADPGCGKTLVGLKLAEHFKANPIRSGKTLVVAPLSLLESAWAEDCAKFTPGLRLKSLWANTPAKRTKLLAEARADVYVVNPEGFKRIIPWCHKQRFDLFIFDESSALANPKAQITKETCRFAPTVPFRQMLSGTPMPNGPLDIWAQIYVCDQQLLGSSYWRFRSLWARQTGYMGYQWVMDPDRTAQLMQLIAPRAMFIKKEDCLDLPEQVFTTRTVYMDPDQREAYDRMLRDKILPLVDGRTAVASNVLSEITKLRQVSSGWIYDEKRKVYAFSDSKAKVLDEVLAELGDRQAIVWTQFIHDADELTKRLEPKAIKIIGGLGPEEVKRRLDDFRAGRHQYLVAHPKTIGHGVTLTNTSYMIFYSLGYSWQEWVQACSRIHRISQVNRCLYVSLLCKNSIDEAIYRAVMRKDNMAKAALEYLRSEA